MYKLFHSRIDTGTVLLSLHKSPSIYVETMKLFQCQFGSESLYIQYPSTWHGSKLFSVLEAHRWSLMAHHRCSDIFNTTDIGPTPAHHRPNVVCSRHKIGPSSMLIFIRSRMLARHRAMVVFLRLDVEGRPWPDIDPAGKMQSARCQSSMKGRQSHLQWAITGHLTHC